MTTTTTHPTTTADAFEYVTADELRAMLDDTPHPDELDEALACLPLDLEAFHAHMATITASRHAASPAEAVSVVHEAIQACALPGHVIGAEFAALIDRAILTAGQLKKAAAAHDRAALLADLAEGIRTRDAAGLAVALGMAPFNSRAYVASLRTLADAMNPDELADPERVQAARVRALRGAATQPLDDELIGAILTALDAWAVLTCETPHQKAVREAFEAARALIDLHGEEDPRAFDAIVKAVNLHDPGCTDRMLAESGIRLPKPDRCTADGVPMYSLEAVAAALDADPEELLVKARELEAHGLGVLHTDITNTHTLQ